MPGTLLYSPADVIRQMFIDLQQGSDPAGNTAWPVYAADEPSTPDNVITVYDTDGRDDGRTMPDGERQEHHGFQVRVRADDHPTGYAKARAIAVALDQSVTQRSVNLAGGQGTHGYVVWSVSRTSDVLALGKEAPDSRRKLFTVNGVAHIRQVS
jgi:hypothetical protein